MEHGDRLVMFDSLKFYKAVKLSCMEQGMTQLRAVIYAILALEEIMRDDSCPDKLPILSTIGAVAIPEIEKLSPMDEVEEAEKFDMLDAYDKGDRSKLEALMERWKRAKLGLPISRKLNDPVKH